MAGSHVDRIPDCLNTHKRLVSLAVKDLLAWRALVDASDGV